MIRLPLFVFATSAMLAAPALAAPTRVTQLDSFRVGSGGVVCTAQNRSVDPALKGMFDRALAIVCQDAASAVGKIYRFSDGGGSGSTFVDQAVCETASAVELEGVAGVTRAVCTAGDTGLRYVRYSADRGKARFLAEGLAGYESALKLGFQSVLLDRAVPGIVDVAVTEAGDPAAFARVQAGNLDPDQALAEGYSRNNLGSFPEAAEFFDTLLDRARSGDGAFTKTSEYAANRALQLSNLGRFMEAEPLFRTAERALDLSDPVQTRLLRNFRMIHALNQRDGAAALAILASPQTSQSIQMPDSGRLTQGYLDKPIVQRINADDGSVTALGGGGSRLSATERAMLLDAQARQLEGAALRITGKFAEAALALRDSNAMLVNVRGGRLASANWLRAGSLIELAAVAEANGKGGDARTLLEEAARGCFVARGRQGRRADAVSRSDQQGARQCQCIGEYPQLSCRIFRPADGRGCRQRCGGRYVHRKPAARSPRACPDTGGVRARAFRRCR
jgi:tetratricopeptide (TPR) repeat protein